MSAEAKQSVQVSDVSLKELQVIIAEQAVRDAKSRAARMKRRMDNATREYYVARNEEIAAEDMVDHLRYQWTGSVK